MLDGHLQPPSWTFDIQDGSLKPVHAAMTIRTLLYSVDSQNPHPSRRVLLTEGLGTEQILAGQCDNANILSTIC